MAWHFVTEDSYVFQFLVHVAHDLGLPQVDNHREAVLDHDLTLANQQVQSLKEWMWENNPNIYRIYPGRTLEDTYVEIRRREDYVCTVYSHYTVPPYDWPVCPRHGVYH
jgi:hypothetical protein